ncbi:hypothetical protein [Streptomyces sp. NBC_01439]|uniref:hypothetical protein n=1 Tax=Streptomyces sp. NBC_01439 TaxID=2903867 RepID=UPI002E2CA9BE|nr:hypothetical protein [Streptomyces sp. NBC_01439]
MTIRVYDVNTQTGRIVRERAHVVVAPTVRDSPPVHPLVFPSCECALCPAGPRPSQRPGPSQELLDRARVGWERFVASLPEPSDD